MKSSIPLWRAIQKENFICPKKLAEFLELDESQKKRVITSSFSLNIPLRLAKKMEKGTLEDPLVKQFVPLEDETYASPVFLCDPLQEKTFQKSPKLLKKYPTRALLVTTSACPMHCRFCFRKKYEYDKNPSNFEKELDFIRKDLSLKEIILSGGDPLSLSDQKLSILLSSLDKISHLKRLRFHTRFPIGIPERICDTFLDILGSLSHQVYFVIHCNHPKELDEEVLSSLKKIKKNGAVLLCQTVLLKGVNDSLEILTSLSEILTDNGILPYYLHQLDPVVGAAHFAVSEDEGKQLVEKMRNSLSGYGVPRYAKEIPHKQSKTILM